MYEPIDIGPFGVVAEDGIEDLLFDLVWPVGLGKINKMRGKFMYGLIIAQILEQRKMFIQVDEVEEAVVDLAGFKPYIHGKY